MEGLGFFDYPQGKDGRHNMVNKLIIIMAILIFVLLVITLAKKVYGQDTLLVEDSKLYNMCFFNKDKFIPSIECHVVSFEKMRDWARRNDLFKELTPTPSPTPWAKPTPAE